METGPIPTAPSPEPSGSGRLPTGRKGYSNPPHQPGHQSDKLLGSGPSTKVGQAQFQTEGFTRMRMKTKLSLGGLLVGALLVAGLSYWAIGENPQPVVPKGSAGAPLPPKVSAPTAPPASTAASPSAQPTTTEPSHTTQPTAPPVSTAASPSAPPATVEPGHTTQPTAPPASTAVLPSAPPATAEPGRATQPTAPPVSTAALPSAPPAIAEPAEASTSEADRRQIQEALHRLNYYQGPVDGIFGPLTRAAIRRFQHDIGAEITGYLTKDEAYRLIRTH